MSGSDAAPNPASFRDPHGFVFELDGVPHRALEPSAEDDFHALIESGLYGELVGAGMLVAHEDLGVGAVSSLPGRRVLRLQKIPVITYPSEWTFSQLKAAALLTLDIQTRALSKGLCLKDASGFNVQFLGAKPIFIDTLSFYRSAGNGPWIAYRQFCQHYLAPLALAAYRGSVVFQLWATALEGVSLSAASRLLPRRTWFRPGVALHLLLHAKSSAREATAIGLSASPARPLPEFMRRLAASLRSAVASLQFGTGEASEWIRYRLDNSYTASDAAAKVDFVRESIAIVKPARALDLGANDGTFSELLAAEGIAVTAVDVDPSCCEHSFRSAAARWPNRILTMRVDLANPTPAFGWAGEERSSFETRVCADLVLALAVIHHLSIAQHIPYERVAAFLARLGSHLIVEHVPPSDPVASAMLRARGLQDQEGCGEKLFLHAFARHYEVVRRVALAGGRVLFLMRRQAPRA